MKNDWLMTVVPLRILKIFKALVPFWKLQVHSVSSQAKSLSVTNN